MQRSGFEIPNRITDSRKSGFRAKSTSHQVVRPIVVSFRFEFPGTLVPDKQSLFEHSHDRSATCLIPLLSGQVTNLSCGLNRSFQTEPGFTREISGRAVLELPALAFAATTHGKPVRRNPYESTPDSPRVIVLAEYLPRLVTGRIDHDDTRRVADADQSAM